MPLKDLKTQLLAWRKKRPAAEDTDEIPPQQEPEVPLPVPTAPAKPEDLKEDAAGLSKEDQMLFFEAGQDKMVLERALAHMSLHHR